MTLAEAVAVYGPPYVMTRRGPVWLIDGQIVYARDLLTLDELGCSC